MYMTITDLTSLLCRFLHDFSHYLVLVLVAEEAVVAEEVVEEVVAEEVVVE